MMSGFDLKVARMRTGQKQWDIAKKLGISQSKLSLIETGRVTATADELSKLCKALGLNK